MQTREEEALYFATHCASCGKKDWKLRVVYCGECFHPYVIPWVGLVFHDWWERVRHNLTWRKDPDLFLDSWMNETRWERIRPYLPVRFKDIYSCPCCAHDF